MTEKKEAWFRLVVLLISGIVLGVWGYLTKVLAIIHWFVVVFSGKRNKDMAEFVEIWNTQVYVFLDYTTFVSNKRPFPFSPLRKNISKFGK